MSQITQVQSNAANFTSTAFDELAEEIQASKKVVEINLAAFFGENYTAKKTISAPSQSSEKGIDSETELLALLSKLSELSANRAMEQLESQQKAQEAQDKKKIEEMIERLKAIREAERWGPIGRALNYVLGGLAIVVGALITVGTLGGGAVLGVGLMVGGAIAITDQALQDTGVLEGGFAGALADAFVSLGMDPQTAQILGMVTYMVLLVAVSAPSATYSAGKAAVTGAVKLATSPVATGKAAAMAAAQGTKAAAVAAKEAALAAKSAIINAIKNFIDDLVALVKHLKTIKNSPFSTLKDDAAQVLNNIKNNPQELATNATAAVGVADGTAHYKEAKANHDALKHEAAALEITAIIETLALKMKLAQEDLKEAFESISDLAGLIMNILRGNKDTAQQLAVLQTTA